tara:strand:+ start:60 stop:437 length:378 start_codon:yes stop_codon:yes gene_type:complete
MTTVATSKLLINPQNFIVARGKVRLNSIHISHDGGSTAQVHVWDYAKAAKTGVTDTSDLDSTQADLSDGLGADEDPTWDAVARIYLPNAVTNLEHDFHGAMLTDGIMVNVNNNASGTVAVTINYS